MADELKIQILIDDLWVDKPISELKKNNLFKVFEPNRTPMTHINGSIFLALSDAYLNAEEIYSVEVDEGVIK